MSALPATELANRMRQIESALYLALEARGHQPEGRSVLIDGERIDFWLYEPDRQTRVPLTAKELKTGFYGSRTWKQELVPSGRPVLVARPDRYGGGERRWTDGGKPLEAQLGDVVARFEAIAKAAKEEHAERERSAREFEATTRRAAERYRRDLEREAQPENLRSLAADWSEAVRLRAFLAALEARLSSEPISDAVTKWLGWARAHVDACDPLSSAGLQRFQVMAEDIEFGPEDEEPVGGEEEMWRVSGMLDEYME